MSMKAGPSFRPPQSSPQLVDEAEEEEDYVLAGSSNEPPPYSSPVVSPGGPSAASSSSRRPLAASTIPTPWLPDLDFSRYSIADATVSKDGTTIVTTSPVLSHDSKALLRFIQDQASLPPLPYIRIVGTPPPGQSRPDFDIKLNMLRYFLPRQQTNSSTTNSTSNWNYVRLVGENELAFRGKSTQTTTPTVKSLEQWAWKFCNEKSSVKTSVF
ncbi:hypothetical protein ASPZODRAFT_128495 [Penicilliopsis zonata CBS 506.65]|uniref:Uncharacterized protein n=1 Tax=Penicilliopsis zonata CBS 506.65 TaxID=1073090 RepID=A0A1L9SRS8_9EURO|nr:hypothetical protein ASPZODRAFT_128495 [Penicilliopsis zonata CBS 506.65]OJJ49919.1 hypothetical protein ASPZODRAFT_128495 [Penicilliopsis zonata CBS 506.65]